MHLKQEKQFRKLECKGHLLWIQLPYVFERKYFCDISIYKLHDILLGKKTMNIIHKGLKNNKNINKTRKDYSVTNSLKSFP